MPKTRQNLSEVSQLRMTKELYDKIEHAAVEDDRPMANMIRVLLTEALKNRKAGK